MRRANPSCVEGDAYCFERVEKVEQPRRPQSGQIETLPGFLINEAMQLRVDRARLSDEQSRTDALCERPQTVLVGESTRNDPTGYLDEHCAVFAMDVRSPDVRDGAPIETAPEAEQQAGEEQLRQLGRRLRVDELEVPDDLFRRIAALRRPTPESLRALAPTAH